MEEQTYTCYNCRSEIIGQPNEVTISPVETHFYCHSCHSISQIITDAKTLSSGTIANLIGSNKYADIDAAQKEFVDWLTDQEELFENWREAWNNSPRMYEMATATFYEGNDEMAEKVILAGLAEYLWIDGKPGLTATQAYFDLEKKLGLSVFS